MATRSSGSSYGQGPSDAEAERSSLAGDAAAVQRGVNVVVGCLVDQTGAAP